MGALQPQTNTHAEAPHGGARMHVTVAIILAVLTVIAFGLVGSSALPNAILIPVILILAVAQIALQVLYYMHLKTDSRIFAGFFLGALALAILIAIVVQILIKL